MCGRQDSDCLPLGVSFNGILSGFDNYGSDNKIIPFYANNSGINYVHETGIAFGPMYEIFKAKQYLHVVNGKAISGDLDPRYFYTWSGDINANDPLISGGWTGYSPSVYGRESVWHGEYSQLLYVPSNTTGYSGRIFLINDTFRR
jgi:hypothetical protein